MSNDPAVANGIILTKFRKKKERRAARPNKHNHNHSQVLWVRSNDQINVGHHSKRVSVLRYGQRTVTSKPLAQQL